VAHRIDLPPHLVGRPFALGEGLSVGVGETRLRGRDLDIPFRGVRAPASHGDLVARCRAYAVRMRTAELFSHRTAVRLWGIPLSTDWALDEPLHVAVVAPFRASRGAGITGHQLSDASIRCSTVNGLSVVDPVSAWLQLAGGSTLDELVVAGDHLVRIPARRNDPRRPFCTVDELFERSAGFHGRGAALARRSAELVREGSDSPQESRLRLALTRAGLPEPALNRELRTAEGGFVARVDMLYRHARVVVEYDGDQHRTDVRQYDRDISRIDELHALGYRVVRVRKRQLAAGGHEAVRLVRAALAAHPESSWP
jgi:very-short-patch-repair endonuclease